MLAPGMPNNEYERLSALRGYEIMDTLPEVCYDDITLLATQLCDSPIALISLLDEKRQWFKSKVGLNSAETPRDISFCGHTINGSQPFIIEDARLDSRFCDNPLVTGELGIVFYAGFPLITPNNHVLGALCVIDHQPRVLNEATLLAMTTLARHVVSLFEARRLACEQGRLSDALRDQPHYIAEKRRRQSLGELTELIAHEINNPLSIALGRVTRLISKLDESKNTDFLPSLKSIEAACLRISNLIRSMALMAGGSAAVDYSAISIKSALDNTLLLLAGKFKNAGIQVQIEKIDENVRARGNLAHVIQVFFNILENATEALKEVSSEKIISIAIQERGSKILIDLKNNGPLIPEQVAFRIFDPLYSTRSAIYGKGMGLSVARSLVEKAGGGLELDQSSGKVSFRIELLKA